jgi:hypothetical protein
MKKLLAVFLAATFAITASQPVQAETTWLPITSAAEGEAIIAIKELDMNAVSSRFGMPPNSWNTNDARICANGPDDKFCDYESGYISFTANQVLPLCKTATDENCIVGLKAGLAATPLVPAEIVREVDIATYDFEDTAKGLYKSGKPVIFKAANAPADGGITEYVVTTNVRMQFDKRKGKYISTELEASIFPFRETSGGNKVGLFEREQANCWPGDADGVCIYGWPQKKTCAWEESGRCGEVVAFTPESRFQLEVRVSKSIAGWFRGRIQRPDISISSFSITNNTVIVSAEPTSVARMEAKVNMAAATEAERALANTGGTTSGMPVAGCKEIRLLCGNIAKGQPAMNSKAIQWVDSFRKAANDTAVGISSLWNFTTIDVNSLGSNRCLADTSKVQGIVTTNATALDGTPPAFSNGTLTYNVAGLHFQPDGKELNLGAYDLVIRSDTARCLYGFGKAPLSATVSVVNEKGKKTTATTVVSEKNGWLKMAAYGFTFSKKTIKVKISKKKK